MVSCGKKTDRCTLLHGHVGKCSFDVVRPKTTEHETVMLKRTLADAADTIAALRQKLDAQAGAIAQVDIYKDAVTESKRRQRGAEDALDKQRGELARQTQMAQIAERMWKDACGKCTCGAYRQNYTAKDQGEQG